MLLTGDERGDDTGCENNAGALGIWTLVIQWSLGIWALGISRHSLFRFQIEFVPETIRNPQSKIRIVLALTLLAGSAMLPLRLNAKRDEGVGDGSQN